MDKSLRFSLNYVKIVRLGSDEKVFKQFRSKLRKVHMAWKELFMLLDLEKNGWEKEEGKKYKANKEMRKKDRKKNEEKIKKEGNKIRKQARKKRKDERTKEKIEGSKKGKEKEKNGRKKKSRILGEKIGQYEGFLTKIFNICHQFL